RTELREQLRVQPQLAFRGDLAQVRCHALAYAGDLEQLLLVADQVNDLIGESLDGLGRAPVRADANGIVTADLHEVSRLVARIGDGFIVQAGSVQFYLAQPLHACDIHNSDSVAVFKGDV